MSLTKEQKQLVKEINDRLEKDIADGLGLPVKLIDKLMMCETEQLICFPGLENVKRANYYNGMPPPPSYVWVGSIRDYNRRHYKDFSKADRMDAINRIETSEL